MLGVEAPGNPIGLKPIPIEVYKEFLRLKLRGAITGKTYSGMRDTGRNAENEEQMKEAKTTSETIFEPKPMTPCQPSQPPPQPPAHPPPHNPQEEEEEEVLTHPDIAKNISMASDPILQELLIEQKVGFYTRKAEKGGKKYFVFRFLLPTTQAKKAIPSSWHPSKRCAGRAMWQWAG